MGKLEREIKSGLDPATPIYFSEGYFVKTQIEHHSFNPEDYDKYVWYYEYDKESDNSNDVIKGKNVIRLETKYPEDLELIKQLEQKYFEHWHDVPSDKKEEAKKSNENIAVFDVKTSNRSYNVKLVNQSKGQVGLI
uniref:Uncharacterized protein n=1 Tax=Euplotes harpa TaxID=151035 RepID=A0A7S3NF29_9SPIT|mmetsp:Transcript_43399/g.51049  ORF Transcript_43399/g.51049 Transcript_43399/m.51049 type:complete len:136 (+) Transcript_43399:395-802(+)